MNRRFRTLRYNLDSVTKNRFDITVLEKQCKNWFKNWWPLVKHAPSSDFSSSSNLNCCSAVSLLSCDAGDEAKEVKSWDLTLLLFFFTSGTCGVSPKFHVKTAKRSQTIAFMSKYCNFGESQKSTWTGQRRELAHDCVYGQTEHGTLLNDLLKGFNVLFRDLCLRLTTFITVKNVQNLSSKIIRPCFRHLALGLRFALGF